MKTTGSGLTDKDGISGDAKGGIVNAKAKGTG